MTTGLLHEDRFFDSDPAVRRAARALYEETRGLPLICPHGHVDPRVLAEDEPFGEPTELILRPDHYILRMLYGRGQRRRDLPRDRRAVALEPVPAARAVPALQHRSPRHDRRRDRRPALSPVPTPLRLEARRAGDPDVSPRCALAYRRRGVARGAGGTGAGVRIADR